MGGCSLHVGGVVGTLDVSCSVSFVVWAGVVGAGVVVVVAGAVVAVFVGAVVVVVGVVVVVVVV